MERGLGDVVDVFDPLSVASEIIRRLKCGLLDWIAKYDRITYQANHFDVSRRELVLQLCESAKLGCTHGREVCGMGEEDSPARPEIFMKVDVSIGGLGFEVGGCSIGILASHF